ncbi:MAG: hypothetical protein CM15mP63_1000 [Gammaproteobacteria bacterium]|nr:MAG: hypothetical protein CM15mP63_1000 [Gammaproteobacteria bacterium]
MERKTGMKLLEGMIFTIEPMFKWGNHNTKVKRGWTVSKILLSARGNTRSSSQKMV